MEEEVPPPPTYDAAVAGPSGSGMYPVQTQPVPVYLPPPSKPGAAPIPGQDGGPVTIRNMVQEDAEFAGRMTVEAFEGKFSHAAGKENLEKLKQIQGKVHADITQCYHRIFIALYNGEQAGLVALKIRGDKSMDGEQDHYSGVLGARALCGLWCLGGTIEENRVPAGVCYLDHICVDGSFRGKGIGKVLMDRAEYEAKKLHCRSIYLWVADENRAKNLYLRQGYTITENEDGYCFTTCTTGIRRFCKMEKSL